MHFLDAGICAELSGLTPLSLVAISLAGVLLWLAGYVSHKFWVVFLATLIAGAIGFDKGPDMGMQGLLAALLFGLSAGILSLSVIRVVVFLFGGSVGVIAVQLFVPGLEAWLPVFLSSGIAALLLYPFWFTAFSSLLGSLVTGYGLLAISAKYKFFDASGWLEKQPGLADGMCLGMVLLGTLVQYFLNRFMQRSAWKRKQDQDRFLKQQESFEYARSGWFGWMKNPWERHNQPYQGY